MWELLDFTLVKRINLCQITEKKDGASKKVLPNGRFKLQLLLTFQISSDTIGYSPNLTGIKTVSFWAWRDLRCCFWECLSYSNMRARYLNILKNLVHGILKISLP